MFSSKKNKKSKYNCQTIITTTNTVQDDGTECLFLVRNLIIPLFSRTFLSEDFGVR